MGRAIIDAMTDPTIYDRWREDEQVLAELGAAISMQPTELPIRLPGPAAEAAVRAWQRDDLGDVDLAAETVADHVARERAAALALIGANVEHLVDGNGGDVDTTLDAWFVGAALDAADDHDLLPAGERPSTAESASTTGDDPTEHGETAVPVASLWLEFEHMAEPVDDFANVLVDLDDGRSYALNVWTFAFAGTVADRPDEDPTGELAQGYSRPPDLLVRELTRPLLEGAVAHLLANGGLPEHRREVR